MLFREIFKSMYTAPACVAAHSRDASLYLLRCIFIMGIRPLPQRYRLLYLIWSFALNFISTVYQPFAFVLGYITHMSELKPSELLDSLQVAFNAWSCSLKVIVLWSMVNRLDEANNILDELDKRCTSKEEQKQIHVATARNNFIFFIYIVVYVGFVIISFLGAAFDGRPPYQNYYPLIDWRANKMQFWVQAILEFIAMLGACFQNVCIDCYPINYVLILRTHIKMLTERVRRLGTNVNQSHNDLHDELINCICDHKMLLRYCDTIRPLVSGTIFVQFTVTSIVLGLILINIVAFADFASAVGAMIFLVAVLSETVPLCIILSFMMDECDKLADAAFQSNWIHAEERYKKTLLYFIHNLQQPIVFKAFNIVPITVDTSISLVKFSFSVFTLLKEMNIAERLTMKAD